MTAPWSGGDPNAVIHVILARPEFRGLKAPRAASSPFTIWLEGVIDAIRSFLHHLLEGSAGLRHVPTYAVLAVLYGIGVMALIAIAYVTVTNLALRSGRHREAAQQQWLAAERTPEELHEEATRIAASGDYAHAISLIFRAALLLLDRAGIVPFDPARTPGEYRRAVRTVLQRGSVAFDDVSGRFVWCAFGGHPAQRDDFEATERSYAALLPATSGA